MLLSQRHVRRLCSDTGVRLAAEKFISGFKAAPTLTPSKHQAVDRSRDVFVNSEVQMDQIDIIGFDFDHTLALYTVELEELVYNQARDYLVRNLRYPSAFRHSTYDPDFARAGLTYDMGRGTLVKLTAENVMRGCRGRSVLSQEELKALYGPGLHISRAYRAAHMRPLVDLFAVAEACLIADLMEHFISSGIPFSPEAVGSDINKAIDHVHGSGSMHNHVAANPSQYFEIDPELPEMLSHLKSAGKELFLLTNSGFSFINSGLNYFIGPHWRELFDVVMVSAAKPLFYDTDRPFREVDIKRNRHKWTSVTSFEPGRVYAQGNADDLVSFMDWQDKSVLYIGDNLLSDSIGPSTTYGWMTGIILRELESHIEVHDSMAITVLDAKLDCLTALMRVVQEPGLRSGLRVPSAPTPVDPVLLDLVLEFLKDRTHFDARPPPGDLSSITTVPQLLDALEGERQALRKDKQSRFHPIWGSKLREGPHPTLFANTVMRYCDLYTSRVSNLIRVPHDYRFIPSMKILPHEHQHASLLNTVLTLEDRLLASVDS